MYCKKVVPHWPFMLLVALLLCPVSLAVAADCQQEVATLVSIQGKAQILRVGQVSWQELERDGVICPGESLKVLEKSRAAVVLANETVLRVRQNSTVHFPAPPDERPLLIKVIQGVLHIFSHRPRSLKVETPYLNGAVEGTEFLVQVDSHQSSITVFNGLVRSSNAQGQLAIGGGQKVVAVKGEVPTYEQLVKPRDGVQWSLYYPPVQGGSIPDTQTGETQGLVIQASRLLAVGEVEAAALNLSLALSQDPGNSDALALQAIIAVVQNEKNHALILARQAVENGPASATARIAMSYVQQAHFDLEGARESVTQAVELDPVDALAWARLAELWSSLGYIDKSLEAADKAVALEPNLARTQMVLGFVYLTQVKTEEAREAFIKAIALDQADPLARLGLGLAIIRDGGLAAGGREIEIAASLDPNNSLVRSYLGKVYFEEKRTGKDTRQYAIAKQLDPNDPTPYFYEAISKQTTNRPVEALHDLQKAIELNDNRAVYRSRLMLDSDEAARSASLAQVYSDLGFQRRALVEGWQATNTDPSNFSAHRFLADSYAVLPRHEIARVSELLQAQLLQPLNVTPIQPRLAESNLYLMNGAGPESLSYTEFHPLFNRNQITVQGSGLGGSDATYGGEGIVSGIYKRLSVSGGYTHYETDGWRENADQSDDIYNLFAQYSLSPQSSIQAEYRYRSVERGDTALSYFEDDFWPNQRKENEVGTARLGLHHSFSPGIDLIGNFQLANGDGSNRNSDEYFPRFDLEADEQSYGGELSSLYRSQYANIIAGGGYFNNDRIDHLYIDDLSGSVVDEAQDISMEHSNLYLYSYITPVPGFTVTLGGSGDFLNPVDETYTKPRDQFNPKVGITWSPYPDTELRGAAFRVLKRTLITDQTIEPTQVAGFNQFFDEVNSTDYWVYGGAIDQKFNQSMYGGVEYRYRNLDVPFTESQTGLLETGSWKESVARAYFFWTPQKWISLSAEYSFEGLKRSEAYSAGAKDVDTHQFPLGISFIHPSGVSLRVKGTYINQEGQFGRADEAMNLYHRGESDFFIVDASIRYRFPKRYGFLTAGMNNLTDEKFQYFDSDPENPRYQPGIFLYGKMTVALP